MTRSENSSGLSRRAVLGAAGAGAAGAAGSVLLPGAASASPGPSLWIRPGAAGAPDVHGLHLQFGADASREVVVSWSTPTSVARPRVLFGTDDDGFGRTVSADTTTYRDAQSGTEVFIHHARLTGLRADTAYTYAALHEGTTPLPGFFRTAPRGRAPLTFTSFGDQGTPTLGKQTTPAGATSPIWVNDNLGSPAGSDTVDGIERIAPLFHLVNGDLCYANLSTDRIRTWSDWFTNNSRSARFRPWMPAAGNHENELGNGPIGYGAYQSYFSVPAPAGDAETKGLWYAFTAGSAGGVRARTPLRAVARDPGRAVERHADPDPGQRRSVHCGYNTRHGAHGHRPWRYLRPVQRAVLRAGAVPGHHLGRPGRRERQAPPVYVREDAPWSAFRDKEHAYRFAVFEVDPGRHRGGPTTMKVTYYAVSGPFGNLTPVDQFTLVRPRRD